MQVTSQFSQYKVTSL